MGQALGGGGRSALGGRAAPQRRAPRLSPDQLIASHITRRGRFAKLDPRKARRLPSFTKVAGAIAWGVFLEEAFRRARRAERQESVDAG